MLRGSPRFVIVRVIPSRNIRLKKYIQERGNSIWLLVQCVCSWAVILPSAFRLYCHVSSLLIHRLRLPFQLPFQVVQHLSHWFPRHCTIYGKYWIPVSPVSLTTQLHHSLIGQWKQPLNFFLWPSNYNVPTSKTEYTIFLHNTMNCWNHAKKISCLPKAFFILGKPGLKADWSVSLVSD